jgi:hypothetical protein
MSRNRPGTDTPGYLDMMRRLVRRAGVRAGDDLAALTALAEIQTRVDAEMRAAVRTLNEGGHSWDEIAAALGKPKQNVWRKYADHSPVPDPAPAGAWDDPAVLAAVRVAL